MAIRSPSPKRSRSRTPAGRPRSPSSALEEAQDLCWDAWDAPDPRRAATLAKRALELSPDCADAYNLLAAHEARTPAEALELYRQGATAGERALGRTFFEQNKGHFWGILETRPYMRARQGVALSLWALGRLDEAAAHYEALLALNPNDNQGNRGTLLALYLLQDRVADAAGLLDRYPDDAMCETLWGRALVRFLQGDPSGAREALAAAMAENRHVPTFLLDKRTMPKRDDGYVTVGGPDEAAEHVRMFGKAWQKHPAALAWLRESLKGQAPRARSWEETEALLQGLLDRLDEACLPLVAARARELMPACPWPTQGLHPEHAAKQLLTWYALDRVDPDTGKTPLRTFAEREVTDPALRAELLKAEHPLLAEHAVVGEQDGHLLLEQVGTREVRRVQVSDATLRQAHKGARITGVLHPWGDHWRTNGIIQIGEDEERAARRLGLVTPRMVDAIMQRYEQGEAADAEGISLRETSTLESVLNKYPSQWVDGIAVALGLERGGRKGEKAAAISAHLRAGAVAGVVRALPEPSRAALRFLIERGGTARFGDVEKRFSTDVGLFWVERPPSSDVGLLRLKGLVVVGKMVGPGAKRYRVAVVPRELRPAVVEALGGVNPPR